jgi:AcrR family transcriptional regulator
MTDNDEILASAFILFMEKGYRQTTTAEIAESAGINESTLFRKYKSKKNLFNLALETFSEGAISNEFDILSYSSNLAEDFEKIIQIVYQTYQKLIPSYRLLCKKKLVKDKILDNITQKLQIQSDLLVLFLDGLISRNLVIDCESAALTNIFVENVFVTVFNDLIIKNESTEKSIDSLTELFTAMLEKTNEAKLC